MEKAKLFAKMMGDSYKYCGASSDWLYMWKALYRVRKLNSCGEKTSADQDATDIFIMKFDYLIQGYTKDQILMIRNRT